MTAAGVQMEQDLPDESTGCDRRQGGNGMGAWTRVGWVVEALGTWHRFISRAEGRQKTECWWTLMSLVFCSRNKGQELCQRPAGVETIHLRTDDELERKVMERK